jgi:hypothetical protein
MRPDRIPFAVLDARDRALTVACGLASFSPSLVPFEPEPTVGGGKRACVARGSSSSASRHRIRARSPVVRIGSTPYVYVGLSVRKIRGGSAWPSRDQLVASSSIIQIQSGCEILPKLTLNSQRLLPATQIKKNPGTALVNHDAVISAGCCGTPSSLPRTGEAQPPLHGTRTRYRSRCPLV